MQEIAKRLREHRAGLNITQREMAQKIKISPASLSAYENGSKMPTLEIALKIADALKVSLDWLCGRDKPDQESSMRTYADVVQRLTAIVDALDDFHIDYMELQADQLAPEYIDFDDLDMYREHYNGPYESVGLARLTTINNTLTGFFKGWQNLQMLLQNGTIDDEIYQAWLDKRLRELSTQELQKRDFVPALEQPPVEPSGGVEPDDEDLPF